MYKNRINFKLRKKLKNTLIIISILCLVALIDSNTKFNPIIHNEDFSNFEKNILQKNLKNANDDSILFQGIEQYINITDTGNLYKTNQEVSLSNQESLNLSYFLDSEHDWQVSKIETSVNNIQDTRNWLNNSGFTSPTTFRKYQVSETSHNYTGPHNPNIVVDTITETGATYMRAHFTRIGFERYYDYFYLRDSGNNNHLITDTFNITNVYSPWIPGNTLKFTYEADGSVSNYGYHMDYYEFMNGSSDYDINSDTWGFNYAENGVSGTNTYGAGEHRNATGMYVGLYGEVDTLPYIFSYSEGAFSEIYQNISIPRGRIINAYLSFDYNVPFGLKSNDNYIYFEINNQRVYSRGMRDIIEAGKGIWYNTGKIYMNLWSNTSEIFDGILDGQQFNMSVGIMSGSDVQLSYFEEAYQNIVWFDNVSLVLTTIANSTQTGVDLKFDDTALNDVNEWGSSVLNLTGNWDMNPVTLQIDTTSPLLSFNLNLTLFGYHDTISKINQQNDNGISYVILKNGTVYWEFYHNFYMPSQYSDFKITIYKPKNWEILSVLDPTFVSREFEGGEIGDNHIVINQTSALYPGWWLFTATSPNYIEISNTKMLKQGQWGQNSFSTGETTKIRTQINKSNEIPPNLALTMANLTIYDPNGLIWYEESSNPLPNGTVVFSDITFTALNSIGGQYNYTIFWSNGTAVGGVESNFIVNHHCSLTLLKPDDAKLDLRTEGTVGDLIYLQVLLEDSENNLTIPDSEIYYNWTDGTHLFGELGFGLYETFLDTGDLMTLGLHNIIIKSNKTGFYETNITLEINLGENTNLQVLESDEKIELHANSTIRFKYTNYAENGIEGALVNVSISNKSLYSIDDESGGVYSIEFSTLFIDAIGTYELSINFSATGYEPQYYKYQFEIIKQSVNLSVYINSVEKSENSGVDAAFNEQLNISVRAISNIDGKYLTGGVVICKNIEGSYQKNLTMYPNYWYNTTIICSPENFSWGDHGYKLEFTHPNYKTATFGFNLFIDRIEIDVNPIGFEDTIDAEVGKKVNIQIQLLDPYNANPIENAIITYIWHGGFGYINQTSPGIYEVNLELPKDLRGNYRVDLVISPNSSIYKSTLYSFILVITDPTPSRNEGLGLFLWIIIGILISVASILGVLSLRSYVIMPRKRKKEAELLSKTQRFKDLRNIQAIVIIHKMSGIPLYSRSYSILERHKKELFSGFIQAITTVGEEFSEKDQKVPESKESTTQYGVEKILELDFKYFYCLIADIGDVRAVFILREKASERLKSQVSNLVLALNLKLSQELENWDGSLDTFEQTIPPIINEYFELYYKGSFQLSSKIDLLKMRKEKSLEKLEIRVLNVIQSVAKRNNNIVSLENIIELVHEENKDLIIEALEVLIEKKLITPINP
ncbi:MAG: hypothetical protein ACFFA3_02020 [Promethearchaeota archaeon]